MAEITIREQLARKKVQWEKVSDALEALLGEVTLESYSFSDSNGTQNAKRRKIAEYKDFIAELEAEIENFCFQCRIHVVNFPYLGQIPNFADKLQLRW